MEEEAHVNLGDLGLGLCLFSASKRAELGFEPRSV